MASKSLIILSLLLVCSVLVSSRHLEESTHKAEEKGSAHFGVEQVKDDTRSYIPYPALDPNRPVIRGRPYRRCNKYYGCSNIPPPP